jgi:hypothetical protein
MAEWLLLLLLVPAIVVPVVLSAGFAGCSFPHGARAALETTFDATGKFSGDGSQWEGFTLVQRIEPDGLMAVSNTPVAQVRIILFASTVMDASIDRIFISGPAATKDWDPGTDLTEVPLPNTPFVVPAGMSVTVGPVDYIVHPPSSDGTDPGQALLVAVDFSVPGTASGVRLVGAPELAGMAAAWWFQYFPPPPAAPRPPEAGLPIRSPGYQQTLDQNGNVAVYLYLIGKIEVG